MSKSSHSRTKKWALLFFAAIAAILATVALVLNDLPSPDQLQNRQVAQSTKIFDRTGETMLYEIHGEEKRTTIPYEEIPEYAKNATIAIEDKDFYTHSGFDIFSMIQGVIIEPLTGIRDKARGGSTITQQLAKNAFLTSERTIIRKIKELIIAFELEKEYTKDEILDLYLNQIPYGGNAYGIEAASRTFFEKSAKDLNLAESALLAALPKAPSYYSPWGQHVNELLNRKDIVLEKMNELGYITEKEKNEAENFEITFAKQATGIKAPHFVLDVQEYLNNKYGEEYVRTAGLKVITTLDWKLQQIAEKAVADGAENNKNLYQGHNAALMAQEASTGQILVMVGSKDYFGTAEPENCAPGKDCRFEGNFNVASQGLRQPGSAMKPFAYVTAFKKGFTPDTVVFDVPTEFASNNPDCPTIFDINKTENENENKECFHPGNFDEKFRGPVKLRTALAQSINIPAVKTLYLAGIDDTLKTAQDFGISTLTERSRYGLSLVLGGGEVTLKDLVGAYSVFAQEGTKHKQTMILKITDSKNIIIEEYKDITTSVINPQYPRLINDILTDIDERSGLFSSSLPLTIFSGHQVALKTGTTNDYRDAWAMGYAPDLVVGVWAGNNNNESMKQRGSSLLAAVPMWSAFMREALKDRPMVSFNKPEPVFSNKPALSGEYITNYTIGNRIYPHIHNLLYYIDKKDPQGPQPSNPENDSQFKNWEDSVLKWANENVPNFLSIYNFPLPAGTQPDSEPTALKPEINVISPKKGDYIRGAIAVNAEIKAQFSLTKIQLFLNDTLIDERNGVFDKFSSYQYTFLPVKTELQNSLKIKMIDSSGNESVKEIILYK